MFVSRENRNHAPVAQLDRASAYEAEGREFEPLRARHFSRRFVFHDFRLYPFVRFELELHASLLRWPGYPKLAGRCKVTAQGSNNINRDLLVLSSGDL